MCRRDACDLGVTTNVRRLPALAAKCARPDRGLCCSFDFTLEEFETLCGVAGPAAGPALQARAAAARAQRLCPSLSLSLLPLSLARPRVAPS